MNVDFYKTIYKTNCYDLNYFIKEGDLIIANEDGSEFDLTKGRIYKAVSNQGVGTFTDCVFVIDDNGNKTDYCTAYFYLYEGELVNIR